MIFSFYSSSFACLEPKLDRLDDWSIFVGIWAIRSVAQDSRQQVDDVCDYFWLNLSQCYLWMIIFVIWSASPSPSLLSSPSPLIDSIAVSVFADIFIELTNTEMAATTLWALEWMWETIKSDREIELKTWPKTVLDLSKILLDFSPSSNLYLRQLILTELGF